MTSNSPKNRSKLAGAALAALGAIGLSGKASAQQSDDLVAASAVDGVAQVKQLPDGSVELVLDNGQVIMLDASQVTMRDGQVYIDAAVAEGIATNDTNFLADNGLLVAAAGVVAAGVGIGVAASGGGDDEVAPAPIDPNVPTAGADNITGTAGADTIDGLGGDDTISGLDGDDNLSGGDGNDTLNGDAGDDSLFGGAGNDTLNGGAGNDLLAGGGGTDILDGGEGIDTNSFQGIGTDVTASLADGTASYGQVNETFQNFENLTGSDNNDSLTGDANANVLDGSAGNDSLFGGGGNDTLQGGEGDDFVQGGGGADVTDGGEGIDTVSFADIGSAVTVDLSAAEDQAQYQAPNGNTVIDQVTNFENVVGSANDDSITGDANDNVLTGGLGSDELNGGEGSDTADFSDLDVPVTVNIDAMGNGTAVRETGFSVTVTDAIVDADNFGAGLSPEAFVTEAVAGNLYFNIHTSDFPAGEIRGQLAVQSDETATDGTRTITLTGDLDASQEPGPTSDSDATGTSTVVITVAPDGTVTYSGELSVVGLAESDLLTPIPGVVSAIHLHNAPTGVNGPVAQDFIVDAGASVDGLVPSGVSGADVINETVETDTLTSIENVIGSDDADSIITSGPVANTIFAGAGDDFVQAGGGSDITDGGEGNDTVSFADIGVGVTVDLSAEENQAQYVVGENTVIDQVTNFENVIGSANDDSITGDDNNNEIDGGLGNDTLVGGAGDDVLFGRGGADNIQGGEGNDFVQAGGGADTTDGGEGIDTVSFADIGNSVTVDLDAGEAQYLAPSGATIVDTVTNFENVVGSSNDDTILGDAQDNVITGGLGDDIINGGDGIDTADFSDLDVPVTINVDGAGNGTATRETGFSVTVNNVAVDAANGLSDADFVAEAVAGNLYYNVHTSDFPAGEVRGQLEVQSDVTDGGGIRTIVLEGVVDASQEPGPTSDSTATGTGTLTIVFDTNTGEATYSGTLSLTGLAVSDLQTPGAGAVSAIHLHNAPAGQNGPIVQDTLVDAGGTLDANSPTGVTEDVFAEVTETDTLTSIEQFILSDDNDSFISAGAGSQTILAGEGDDFVQAGGGSDVTDGGAGNDTVSFADIGNDVEVIVDQNGDGTAEYLAPSGATIVDTLTSFENFVGSANSDTLNLSNFVADESDATVGVRVDLDVNTPQPGPASQDGVVQVNGETVFEADDFENIVGTAGNDTLLGNNEINEIFGGAGDDAIHTFGGADIADGGEGIDTVLLTATPVGTTLDLDDNGDGTVVINGMNADVVSNFENISGSNAGDDTLSGNSGVNVLNGNGGDDTLTGEGGDDFINGGEGNDTAVFNDLAANIQVTNNGDGTLTVLSADGTDTLTSIETILDQNGDPVMIPPAPAMSTSVSEAPMQDEAATDMADAAAAMAAADMAEMG